MMLDRDDHDLDLISLPRGGLSFEKFNLKKVAPFCNKSISEETRRAYHRVTREFFRFFNFKEGH